MKQSSCPHTQGPAAWSGPCPSKDTLEAVPGERQSPVGALLALHGPAAGCRLELLQLGPAHTAEKNTRLVLEDAPRVQGSV